MGCLSCKPNNYVVDLLANNSSNNVVTHTSDESNPPESVVASSTSNPSTNSHNLHTNSIQSVFNHQWNQLCTQYTLSYQYVTLLATLYDQSTVNKQLQWSLLMHHFQLPHTTDTTNSLLTHLYNITLYTNKSDTAATTADLSHTDIRLEQYINAVWSLCTIQMNSIHASEYIFYSIYSLCTHNTVDPPATPTIPYTELQYHLQLIIQLIRTVQPNLTLDINKVMLSLPRQLKSSMKQRSSNDSIDCNSFHTLCTRHNELYLYLQHIQLCIQQYTLGCDAWKTIQHTVYKQTKLMNQLHNNIVVIHHPTIPPPPTTLTNTSSLTQPQHSIPAAPRSIIKKSSLSVHTSDTSPNDESIDQPTELLTTPVNNNKCKLSARQTLGTRRSSSNSGSGIQLGINELSPVLSPNNKIYPSSVLHHRPSTNDVNVSSNMKSLPRHTVSNTLSPSGNGTLHSTVQNTTNLLQLMQQHHTASRTNQQLITPLTQRNLSTSHSHHSATQHIPLTQRYYSSPTHSSNNNMLYPHSQLYTSRGSVMSPMLVQQQMNVPAFTARMYNDSLIKQQQH